MQSPILKVHFRLKAKEEIFLTHIHDCLIQIVQKGFCLMVVVVGFVISRSFHERNIFFTQAVDHDVRVDVAGAIMAIGVGDDQCLMAGKIFLRKVQAECLRLRTGQSIFSFIARIKADDIVVGFHLIKLLVFAEICICLFAFMVEIHGIAEDAVHIKFFAELQPTLFVQNWFLRKFIVLIEQIFDSFAVVSVFACDVF